MEPPTPLPEGWAPGQGSPGGRIFLKKKEFSRSPAPDLCATMRVKGRPSGWGTTREDGPYQARRGAVVARQAHNLEVSGSNPLAAIQHQRPMGLSPIGRFVFQKPQFIPFPGRPLETNMAPDRGPISFLGK